MQQRTNHRDRIGSYVVIAPNRRTRWVLAGQKEHYNMADPADQAELRTVLSYSKR